MKPLSTEVYGGVDEWVMERAAGRGTAVHNAIENWSLYGIEDIAPEYRGYFDGFLAWVQEMRPEVLGNECRLYHKALRYAGTADLSCYQREGGYGGRKDHLPAPRDAGEGTT